MKTYLYKHPETITKQQLEEEMLPLLPSWRREQATQHKFLLGQVLCAKSFLMLQDGLKNDFGISGELTFDYLEHKKPVLREYPNIHFNLSHCKKGILCVIDDKNPVGCDIEIIDRKVGEALVLRCCSESELQQIRQSANPGAEFIKLWTVKEAVLKYTGRGLVDDLPGVLTDKLLSTIMLETKMEDGFVYTTCQKKDVK